MVVFAELGDEPGGEVAQSPVVVDLGSQAQLLADHARNDGRHQFVELTKHNQRNRLSRTDSAIVQP